MNQHSSEKDIVRSFYQEVIGKRNTELAKEIISEGYIQHNPRVKTGLTGVLEAVEYLKQFPIHVPVESPIKLILAEEEYVVVCLLVEMGSSQQAVIDLFRVEAGKLVEHWDGIQKVGSTSLNGNPVIGSMSPVTDFEATEDNKAIVVDYVTQVLIHREVNRIPEFLSPDLIQHHPEIENGSNGVLAFLSSNADWNIKKIHRVIGEGNYVLVQSEGTSKTLHSVIYDLFRVKKGSIVEQWTISQPIPKEMAHCNGML